MKSHLIQAATFTGMIIVAGLILHFGRKLPVIAQAQAGFSLPTVTPATTS